MSDKHLWKKVLAVGVFCGLPMSDKVKATCKNYDDDALAWEIDPGKYPDVGFPDIPKRVTRATCYIRYDAFKLLEERRQKIVAKMHLEEAGFRLEVYVGEAKDKETDPFLHRGNGLYVVS